MSLDNRTIGLLVIGGVILLVVAGVYLFQSDDAPYQPRVPDGNQSDGMSPDIVAQNLDVPWGIAFLPDGDMLVTERPGTLMRVEDGQTYQIDGVRHVGEGGLLGVAVRPNFAQNNHIYLYMTTQNQDGDGLTNRVVRYTYQNDQLSNPTVLIDGIPGAVYHDGGRIAFGPDGLLYITTGDSGTAQLAQDRNSLAGKILRLNPDGSIPADNPDGTPVYSYGHRNAQGLAWDDSGNLWAPEHGEQGMDELNLVESGTNYGWPAIEGDETQSGMASPAVHSGSNTWAPAGAAYVDGHIVFAGLRGRSLYVAEITGNDVASFKRIPMGQYGRLRAVELGPDGNLYVSTSNTDGRGNPRSNDDRVLRFDPAQLIG